MRHGAARATEIGLSILPMRPCNCATPKTLINKDRNDSCDYGSCNERDNHWHIVINLQKQADPANPETLFPPISNKLYTHSLCNRRLPDVYLTVHRYPIERFSRKIIFLVASTTRQVVLVQCIGRNKQMQHQGQNRQIMSQKAILRLSAIALVVVSAFLVLQRPTSAENPITTAWQRAQARDSYRYRSQIEQTVYPAPRLSNVGKSAETLLAQLLSNQRRKT